MYENTKKSEVVVIKYECGHEELIYTNDKNKYREQVEEDGKVCSRCYKKIMAKLFDKKVSDEIMQGVTINERSIMGYYNQFNANKNKELAIDGDFLAKNAISYMNQGMSMNAIRTKGELYNIVQAVLYEVSYYQDGLSLEDKEKTELEEYIDGLDKLILMTKNVYRFIGDIQDNIGFIRSIGGKWHKELYAWIINKMPDPAILDELRDVNIQLMNIIDYEVYKKLR